MEIFWNHFQATLTVTRGEISRVKVESKDFGQNISALLRGVGQIFNVSVALEMILS